MPVDRFDYADFEISKDKNQKIETRRLFSIESPSFKVIILS